MTNKKTGSVGALPAKKGQQLDIARRLHFIHPFLNQKYEINFSLPLRMFNTGGEV